MKKSKRYTAAKGLIEQGKTYTVDEAIELAKKTATTKFDGAVELHIRLGVDPKHSDQMIRGTVVLPHGSGKATTVAAFVPADKAAEAKEAGADKVYDAQDIEKIASGAEKIDFDIAVATPDMMRELGKIAKMLGQKGLMPNPKTETVTPNVGQTVKELKGGKISYKMDANGIVHQIVGRVSFDDAKLKENIEMFMDLIKRSKPESLKSRYILGASLNATMGPGLKLEF